MMIKVFSEQGWDDYQYWVEHDRKVLKKINELIRDIERNGNTGLGKPEALRHNLEGFWSRRITQEHRLVYAIMEGNIHIAECRFHYR